jgi:hypothetical protein
MENIRKSPDDSTSLVDIGDDARRQYIDARSAFVAWEDARRAAAEVRGGMYWKREGQTDYLIRTSTTNAQRSLGPRSTETEAMYNSFRARKTSAERREADLAAVLERHQRMNRALFVGRAPKILVDILNTLSNAGLAEHFTVVGTHALYAYEAAAGVRISSADALATKDVDLLWDTRKRLQFLTQMKKLSLSTVVGLLQKVDPTFKIRPDQKQTAVNAAAYEVDVIRREIANTDDPNPLRITPDPGGDDDDDDDFWAVQARRAGDLLSGEKFSSVIVASTGHMARMDTISPVLFCDFKRWMATQGDREPMKRSRDVLQANLMDQMIDEYLPQLRRPTTSAELREDDDTPSP